MVAGQWPLNYEGAKGSYSPVALFQGRPYDRAADIAWTIKDLVDLPPPFGVNGQVVVDMAVDTSAATCCSGEGDGSTSTCGV
jgi:hypothetical protein